MTARYLLDTNVCIETVRGAIALVQGLILVTHNTHEFSRIPGLQLEDWQIECSRKTFA